ncbi:MULTISPECIES: bifunctional DNA primase/polymerase [Bradyrhizobium]|uniref:Virulence-associated protein E n=2 Tax=Bradyrhizobium TaxID=374 RepID=A0ABY0PJW4_9BRAD|nr:MULTISPECIES: bifunctional DNA primase/polymerase [Bradyrhizobium]SDI54744.1 Virulence-associated protein E [Bradyrhizobium ottawaense]SED42674.1 Virulence-associated protein E [Bradyrhizobium lablabi]
MTNKAQSAEKFKPRQRTADIGLGYLDEHFYRRFIFPIKPGKKFPPTIKNNLEDASNDPAQIRAWAEEWPGCNWGVALRKSKLLVADVDTNPKKGKVGQATYDDLDLIYGWPETETTFSPSGGFHKIYEGWATDEHPEHIMALGANGLGKDIDCPNYLLIPGCVFDDGTSYTWNNVEAVRAPAWMYETIRAAKTKSRIANAGEVVVELDQDRNIELAIDFLKNDAEPSIQGSLGDFNLFKVAAYLKDIGISQQLGAELLNEYFNPRCEPPWDMDDFERKMASAYTSGNLSKVGGKTAEADFDGEAEEPIVPMGDAKKIKREKAEREALQQREASKPVNVGARKYTRAELVERWVYVRGLERFVCRDDPPPRARGADWDPDVNERPIYSASKFDKAFMSVRKKTDGGRISDGLLSEKKGGIAHFEGMVYRPGSTEFAGENYNVYRPSPIKLAPADTDEARDDVAMWNAHLDYLFKDDKESRDHMLNFIAWRIRYPGKKMKHALILQGEHKGTGKSFIGRMMTEILGHNNIAYPRESDLSNKFNAWAAAVQLVIIEELRAVDKHKIKSNLHPMITEEVIPVEFKGVDAKKFSNCFGIFGMTNGDAALSIDTGDRRYLVIRTMAVPRDKPSYGEGFDPLYYEKLFAILNRPASIAAIGWELRERDLGGYNAQGSAPMTAAKADMIDAGGPPLQQWMIENAGTWPLCARLTTVEEIVQIVPRRFHGAYLDQNVTTALKAAFNGARAGRIPVNGTKRHLWSINNEVEVNRLIRERDAASKAGEAVKVTNRNTALAAIYLGDLAAAKRTGAATDGSDGLDEVEV